MFFFQLYWSQLFFLLLLLFLALALSLLSTLMQTLLVKRKTSGILVLFFVFPFFSLPLKVRVAMRFTAETREVLEMQNVTSAYMKGRTITSQPNFLIHGAPRARVPLILATEYASYASQRA